MALIEGSPWALGTGCGRLVSRSRWWYRPWRLRSPPRRLFAQTQVFIVQSEHQQNLPPFQATQVKLDQRKLTPRARRELIVAFTAEQGFARRPLPLDSHGLVLHANGELKPDGLDYEEQLQKHGISSKAGDRLVISDIKIDSGKIVFEFNGGPDHKHKYLRHIEIGGGLGSVAHRAGRRAGAGGLAAHAGF